MMKGIPIEYLAKMGGYSIKLEGVNMKVKVVAVDCTSLLETYINGMRTAVLKTSPRVVGADIKRFTYRGSYYESMLVLYGGAANCLIIYLQERRRWGEIPEVLSNFVRDPDVCVVGSSTRHAHQCQLGYNWGVGAGALAAMVLQKPTLTGSSLQDISREVGVHYDRPSTGTELTKFDSMDPLVLTPDQVKLAVSDAYAYYNVGHKLLASL